jgi:UDP-N-acetyl-D-mannosaminuronic acid transferase (WecB/TagA/CpsF family)
VAVATTPFVTWLGDDDRLAPGSLVSTIRHAEKVGAVAVFGRNNVIDVHGRVSGSLPTGRWAVHVSRVGADFVPQPGCIFRSSAWRAVCGLREEFKYAFDLDLFLRLDKYGRVAFLNQVVADFRWHSGGLTSMNPNPGLEARKARIDNLSTWRAFLEPLIWRFAAILSRVIYKLSGRLPMSSARVGATSVSLIDAQEAAKWVIARCLTAGIENGAYVVAAKMGHIVMLEDDLEFRSVYNAADLRIGGDWAVCAVASVRAGRWVRRNTVASLAMDVMAWLPQGHKSPRLVLLSGDADIATRAATNIRDRRLGLEIVEFETLLPGEWENEKAHAELVVRLRALSNPLVFLSLHGPQQEVLAGELAKETGAVVLCVDGALDFLAGKPRWDRRFMKNADLDWFRNLVMERWSLFGCHVVAALRFPHIVIKNWSE